MMRNIFIFCSKLIDFFQDQSSSWLPDVIRFASVYHTNTNLDISCNLSPTGPSRLVYSLSSYESVGVKGLSQRTQQFIAQLRNHTDS